MTVRHDRSAEGQGVWNSLEVGQKVQLDPVEVFGGVSVPRDPSAA